MKALIKIAAGMAAMAFALSASAAPIVYGDVNAGGDFNGAVTNSSAWIASNAIDGDTVNFWTFNGYAGDKVSLWVTSPVIEFGASLYQGIVDDLELLFAGFNNAGSFGDNVYVASTNPVTGAIGTSLIDILIPVTGIYTIAVGGEQGLSFDGLFAYDMKVDFKRVPEPATGALMLLSAFAMFGMRRLRRS